MKGSIGRRQFLRLSAATGGMALLAACAPKPAPSGEPTKAPVEATSAPAAGPAKISIMWRTSAEENPMVDNVIAKYKEKRPNVTVEQIMVPWAEYEPKLMSMYAGGIPPDIYGTGGTNPWVERTYRGMVMTLDPYVEKEGKAFTDDIWPVGIKSYTIAGKLVALTFCICEAGVFINATRFDEAGVPYPTHDWKKGWTWEEMVEAAKQLTRDTNNDGKTDVYGLNAGHSRPWYYTRLWGQDLISAEDYASGIEHKWQTDKKEVYDACVASLQARADTINVHKIMPTPATAAALGQIGPMLKTGAVAMEFTGGWALWGELPKDFKFRAAVNPRGGVNGSGTTCRNCWCDPMEIGSKTKSPDEAWAFIKFFTVDPDATQIQIKARAVLPASRSAFDAYLKEYGGRLAMTEEEQRTFFMGALEQAETTVPDHILVGNAALGDIQSAELDPVWNGERTAKEGIDILIPKVNAKLQEVLKGLNLS